MALSLLILTEARLGNYFANQLWKAVSDGIFDLLDLSQDDLRKALDIERKYLKAGFGIVDATCFMLCEKHRIYKVFTFDRKHFSLYRPRFTDSLELLP